MRIEARWADPLFLIVGVAAILAGGWAAVNLPLIKIPARSWLRVMERKLVRTELTEQEQELLERCRDEILGQHRAQGRCLAQTRRVAMFGLPIMGVLLILSTIRKRDAGGGKTLVGNREDREP